MKGVQPGFGMFCSARKGLVFDDSGRGQAFLSFFRTSEDETIHAAIVAKTETRAPVYLEKDFSTWFSLCPRVLKYRALSLPFPENWRSFVGWVHQSVIGALRRVSQLPSLRTCMKLLT